MLLSSWMGGEGDLWAHMGLVAVSCVFLIDLELLACLAEMKPEISLETQEKAAFCHYVLCKNMYLVMHWRENVVSWCFSLRFWDGQEYPWIPSRNCPSFHQMCAGCFANITLKKSSGSVVPQSQWIPFGVQLKKANYFSVWEARNVWFLIVMSIFVKLIHIEMSHSCLYFWIIFLNLKHS